MSADVNLDIPNLEQWQAWLDTLQQEAKEKLQSRILRSAGLRTLEHVHDGTPRRTGRLQNSFNFGDRDNVFQLHVGNTSYIAVGTAVEYAQAVEEGFTQRAGQFVPGYWDNGGNFVYVPGDEAKARKLGGMVLTGKVVEGAHMVQRGLDRMVNEDLQTIAEFEFRRLYAELMR